MKIEKVSTTTTTTTPAAKGGKKSGKKDRHSKINTAQGPRDRRMRLSLKVAREFFDLQDKLGYDKASKTVEWLLTQAKPEINNFMMSCSGVDNNVAAKSASSATTNSECEVVSQIINNNNNTETKEISNICVKNKERKVRQQSPKNSALRGGPLPKESREKARARARERTRMMKLSDHHHQHLQEATATTRNSDQLIQLSSWSPFEAADYSSSGHNNNPSTDQVQKPSYVDHQQETTTPPPPPPPQEGTDKYWNNTTFPSTFGYLLNTSTSTGIPQQQNQSAYSQFFNKPWDCYNNINPY